MFSLLFGISAILIMVRAVAKTVRGSRKVWESDEWLPFQMDETDYEELRKHNPHIWIN